MNKLMYVIAMMVCLLAFAGLTSQAEVQNNEADASRWICWGPGAPDPCRNRLNDVAITPGSGGDDVWAVGDAGTILHWDGQAWTKIPSNTGAHLFGVAMVSATQGWAVGSDGVIVEWNGSAWTALPPKSEDWYRAIDLVPGAVPAEAWAPGDRAGVGSFLYYDGVKWDLKYDDYFPIFGGTIYDLSMLGRRQRLGGGQQIRWGGLRRTVEAVGWGALARSGWGG